MWLDFFKRPSPSSFPGLKLDDGISRENANTPHVPYQLGPLVQWLPHLRDPALMNLDQPMSTLERSRLYHMSFSAPLWVARSSVAQRLEGGVVGFSS